MSDRPENQPAQANTSVPEKSGCMTCLGVILLLAAVAGCLYYFIVKPAMEERGFDVQEKLDNAKIQAGETFDSVKEKFSTGSKTVAEKYTEFKETAGQIKNSETVERTRYSLVRDSPCPTVSGQPASNRTGYRIDAGREHAHSLHQ